MAVGTKHPGAGAAAERMYTTRQLLEALQAGCQGLADQLQVLSILDGTATGWPGVAQAMSDLEVLVSMAAARTAELDSTKEALTGRVGQLEARQGSLSKALAGAQTAKAGLQADLEASQQAVHDMRSQLDEAQAAGEQQGREIRELEQQQGQLRAEVDGLRSSLAAKERELKALTTAKEAEAARARGTAQDLTQQLQGMRQELAVRTTEAQHMAAAAGELRGDVAHARQQLRVLQGALSATQQQLEGSRAAAGHWEQQAMRLQQEASELAAALATSQQEASRLQEWQAILKRMEADKLAEAETKLQEAWQQSDAAAQQAAANQAVLAGEIRALEERLQGKQAELAAAHKQLGLLGVQLREAQRGTAAAGAERVEALHRLECGQSEATELQRQLAAAELTVERLKVERLLAEGAVKEAASGDKTRLEGALSEALREVAVHKALADGWQRDIKLLQGQLQSADAVSCSSHTEQEQLRLAAVQASAAADARAAELRGQVEAGAGQLQRAKAEAALQAKQYEQALQQCRRAADAEAGEVGRLASLVAAQQQGCSCCCGKPAAASPGNGSRGRTGAPVKAWPSQARDGCNESGRSEGAPLQAWPSQQVQRAAGCAGSSPQQDLERQYMRQYMHARTMSSSIGVGARPVGASTASGGPDRQLPTGRTPPGKQQQQQQQPAPADTERTPGICDGTLDAGV